MQAQHSVWHIIRAGKLLVGFIISNLLEPWFPLSYNVIQVLPSQGDCEIRKG